MWTKVDLRYIKNYVILVKGNAMTIDEVPEKYRQAVADEISSGLQL